MIKITRRQFCFAALGGAAALALSACGMQSAGSASGAASAASGSAAASSGAASSDAAASGQGSGTVLDDGRLRLFYGGGSSANTIFCGASVLYTAPANGTAYLLSEYDPASDQTPDTQYYVTGIPSGSDQYAYSLCDKTGSTVYSCEGSESVSSLVGDWVLIHHSDWSEGGPVDGDGSGKFVDLKTGASADAPDFAGVFYRADADTIAASCDNWGDGGTWSGGTYLYDNDMQQKQVLDGYSSYMTSGFSGWLILSRYLTASDGTSSTQTSWYELSTGKTIENVQQSVGGRCLSIAAQDGGCSILDIDSGETVQTFASSCQWYAGGNAILNSTDGGASGYNFLLHRADGTEAPVRTYDSSAVTQADGSTAGTTLVLLTDSLEAYDESGQLLYTLALTLPDISSGESCTLSQLGGGRFLLQNSVGASAAAAGSNAIYGKDGLVKDLSDTSYSSLYQLYGADGYLVGVRSAYGNTNGQQLYDLLDADGNACVTGLAYVGADSSGIFSARRGFEEGWMDASGSWLWHRSIWQEPADESANPYYY